jgi:hypothetical protein
MTVQRLALALQAVLGCPKNVRKQKMLDKCDRHRYIVRAQWWRDLDR